MWQQSYANYADTGQAFELIFTSNVKNMIVELMLVPDGLVWVFWYFYTKPSWELYRAGTKNKMHPVSDSSADGNALLIRDVARLVQADQSTII